MKTKVFVQETKFKGIEKNPSLLGFGCMRFPTKSKDQPDIDEDLAYQMIDDAYQHGVTYFDTAYPYHHGMSETLIGKALKKYPRDSFYLATKMPTWLIESVDDAKRIFYEQLEKCQVDYFDFYLCHALNRSNYKAYQIPGVMDFLYQMKKEGRIHHLGFSFHDTPEILNEIIHTFKWDFVQLQLNYLDWEFQDAKTQYKIVEDYGIPCIVMEPVRGGLLASLSDKAKEILVNMNPNVSIASWAIRYAASKPNVMVVLSGMSNLEQTQDNIKTMSQFKPIEDEEQRVIDQALKVFLESNAVPCTGCSYCMPCPEGVDIPELFRIYNRYMVTKSKMDFKREYERLEEGKRANLCVSCGECMSQCPQKINIPKLMQDISSLYNEICNS
jgi:uncharacterized protein